MRVLLPRFCVAAYHKALLTKLGPILFEVMVNDLFYTWGPWWLICSKDYSQKLPVLNDIHRRWHPEIRSFPKFKSMVMDFLQYNSCEISPISTGGSVVEQVSSFQLLAVFISQNLTWNRTHTACYYILKKNNKRLYLLRQFAKCGLPPIDIVKVYCTWIRPIVECYICLRGE